jgi:hypothetical protein
MEMWVAAAAPVKGWCGNRVVRSDGGVGGGWCKGGSCRECEIKNIWMWSEIFLNGWWGRNLKLKLDFLGGGRNLKLEACVGWLK